MEPNVDETESFNKLGAGDVWKDFQCPKYIFCTCPQTDKLPIEIFKFYEDFKSTANSNLENLCNLISDPVTRTSVIRISRLLYEYLQEVGDNGYKVKDLPLVTNVLKFLAQNVGVVKEYKLHLDRMLKLCNVPPLLEKSSESLIHCCVIEQYFTLLGRLLSILPTKQQALKVHKALHSLLLKHKKKNLSAIKLEHCRNAVEKSELPVIVVNYLENSSLDKYSDALELIFLLSSVSCICSRRMLEANVLNTILTRMNLPYSTVLCCTRPPDSLFSDMQYSDYTTVLILDTLQSLLKCIIYPNDVQINLGKNLKFSNCALWGLCYAFKCHVLYGYTRNYNIKIRNDIAMIILIISVSFPSWNLVSTGIAETVIKYLVGMESETVRVFSEMIRFGRTNEDLYFEKILLLIVVQLAESDASIYLMKQEGLMLTILQLVNQHTMKGESAWSASQFWNLWTDAMNVLAILTLKMPDQFLQYNGSVRLYMLLEWCLSIKIDIKIIMTCTKTICTIIKYNNKHVLECFREHGIVLLLIRLINYTLKSKRLTMEQQRVLTLAFMSAESLIRKEKFYQELYGDYSVALVMKLLFRCFYQKDEEFQVDQRLLLAIGSYIWECIIWCPEILEKFIECEGIYIILDIIETTPYYCCCLFLAVLTDVCDNFFSGPFLCTWRGKDKKTGLMSLLAKLWREEEIRMKAKRYTDSNLGDNQMPQMSNKQWLETYSTKLTRNVSPAIEDMIGSVRSKIYSICKIVERDNDRYKLAKEHYKMLHAELSMEDRITISTIELYFALKLGQVSVEVAKYFEQVGMNLLGIDSQALFLMTQKYNSMGIMTSDRQSRIIKSVKEGEEVEEKDEYARIRDSRLILALDAFDELDYIYRTMDKSYMLKKKNEQVRQVNMALNFPQKSEDAHCHRTFQDKIRVTAVFNQHQTISSGLRPNTDLSQVILRLPLISPSDSYISDKAYYSEMSLPISSACYANIEKFTENE